MKVLDPQSALLPTAEVYQFLRDNQPRKADRKIGAYDSVNVQHYFQIRRDLETYIQSNTPYATIQSYSEQNLQTILHKLKKYDLTKTEVFSLVNLGIGLHEATPPAISSDNTNGDHAEDEQANSENQGEAEDAGETGLNRMLFGLVVEESDERYSGDRGEQRIAEILEILSEEMKGVTTNDNGHVTNGDEGE